MDTDKDKSIDIEKNRVKVNINGVEYVLKTTEDYEYVQRVALMVDKNMRDVGSSNSKLSTAMIAVLTSINLADKCIKAEEELSAVKLNYGAVGEELKNLREDYEESEIRLELLKDEIQRLKIEIAKKDTELKNYISD